MVGVHAWRQGESLLSFVTWCLGRAWSTILWPILYTSAEEACEDRLVSQQ